MKHFGTLALLGYLARVGAAPVPSNLTAPGIALNDTGACQTINWYEHESELPCLPSTDFDTTTKLLGIVNTQFLNLDSGNVFHQPQNRFSKDGYTYNFAIDTTSIVMSSIDDVSIKMDSVSSALELGGKAVIKGDLSFTVNLKATLTQVSNALCRDDEEEYLGLCYKKCSLMNADRPLRTATNTCSKNGCNSNEDWDGGLCYPKCNDGYSGSGISCIGNCPSGFTTYPLTCTNWGTWQTIGRPLYTRGIGTLPYAPDTNGLGCNGYGISATGGCARIRSKWCFGQPITAYTLWNIIVADNPPCPSIDLHYKATLKISDLTIPITAEAAVMGCKHDVDLENSACNRVRPGDYLGQFINAPFDSAHQALFNRVVDMRLTGADLSALDSADFSLNLVDTQQMPQNFVDYATSQATSLINKQAMINSLKPTLQKNVLSAAKQTIDAYVSPYFGTECPPCQMCTILPVPSANQRCASGLRLLTEEDEFVRVAAGISS